MNYSGNDYGDIENLEKCPTCNGYHAGGCHRAAQPAASKTTWIKPPLPAGVEDTPEVRRASDALDNNLALG